MAGLSDAPTSGMEIRALPGRGRGGTRRSPRSDVVIRLPRSEHRKSRLFPHADPPEIASPLAKRGPWAVRARANPSHSGKNFPMDLRNIRYHRPCRDHGKTTLVDNPSKGIRLLPRGSGRRPNAAMDSQRTSNASAGSPILAKATSVEWKGHAHQYRRHARPRRFGRRGGADPESGGRRGAAGRCRRGARCRRSKFVTPKGAGARPASHPWFLNKGRQARAEPDRALNEVFDLFARRSMPTRISSTSPHLYASGRAGWADAELDGPRE